MCSFKPHFVQTNVICPRPVVPVVQTFSTPGGEAVKTYTLGKSIIQSIWVDRVVTLEIVSSEYFLTLISLAWVNIYFKLQQMSCTRLMDISEQEWRYMGKGELQFIQSMISDVFYL